MGEALRLIEKDLAAALVALSDARDERDELAVRWNPVGKTVAEREEYHNERARCNEAEMYARRRIAMLTRQHVLLQDALNIHE